MKVDLNGKTALVTGGASGIGLATAESLAANGAVVVIADIDEPAARATAASIPKSHALRMDICRTEEIEEGVGWIEDNLGPIDILINNAGINTLHHRVTIDQFPIEEWDRIMDVDLRGLFLVSRAVSARMLSRPGSRIVNVSSVVGLVPTRLQCAFTAAKAGVINLTRAMALELAPKGILVNCVAPGSTLTPVTKKLFYSEDALMQKDAERLLAHIPLGRAGEAEEIAHAILFFVAPESSYITGQTLSVDGGWTVGGYFRDF